MNFCLFLHIQLEQGTATASSVQVLPGFQQAPVRGNTPQAPELWLWMESKAQAPEGWTQLKLEEVPFRIEDFPLLL